jgi:eukaryotic-like serine/threonine-protein kinase
LHPEARKLLSAGETSVPSAYYLYVQALGHLARHDRAEDVERAIGLFLQALQADPNYALASAGAGEAYWRKFHLTKDPASIEAARKYCARALELNSGLAQAHVLLGLIQTGSGRYDDGVKEFQRALQLDPINASALRGLARSYEQQGRREEAEAAYQKAVQLRPRDWAGYRELGVFYHRLGRLPDAERCFLRVIELAPDSYLGYRNLGGLYWSMGRFDEAIRQTQKSLAILPTAPAYSNLGAIYFLQGRYQEASAVYEKALALGAADERLIWGNLAESYRVSGRRGKAAEAYRQAIRLAERDLAVNPRNAELRASLALYTIGISDTQRALTEIAQARKLAPESWTVLFRAALVYEMAGRRDEALQALEGALKQGCPFAEVQRHPDLAELRRDPRYAALPGSPGATAATK